MKIRIRDRANWGGVSLSIGRLGEPGAEYEVPDDEGATLCAEGFAEPVADEPEKDVETSTPPDAEKRPGSTAKRGPGRPRKSQG